ncbi:PSPH (predicted) [Pycnogonum litorale]
MSEGYSFKESFKARLDLMKPSLKTIQQFLDQHPPTLTPGASELVENLQRYKKNIYLITGGIESLVKPVAEVLNIPMDHVFCNELIFGSDGQYITFDDNKSTCRSRGKVDAIQEIRSLNTNKKIVMIGDGITDLETKPFVDLFIGFGGNQEREVVKTGSSWYIYDFSELVNEL